VKVFEARVNFVGDALASDPLGELQRTLRGLAGRDDLVELPSEGVIRDINGNACGEWSFAEVSEERTDARG
jgi:hypothetical protein